jgi:patatin-like phospholipase/acyl hydrolase
MLKNSDQDNYRLDNTFIEFAIFGLWKIDLVNFIKTKAILSKEFKIQPTEVDKMPMWEYELFLQHLNSLVKEENDNQRKEMDKYHIDDYKKTVNQARMNKTPNYSIPKIPNISNSFK